MSVPDYEPIDEGFITFAKTCFMDPNDRDYSNEDITVSWIPKKCIHATTCYRELLDVFNPRKRPWVNMQGAPTEKIIEVVNKCPTQALTWRWNDEEKEKGRWLEQKPVEEKKNTETPPVWIQIMKDGPIVAQGKFKVFDGEGKQLKTYSFTSFCRCGSSRNMPFCDGNHRLAGFNAE